MANHLKVRLQLLVNKIADKMNELYAAINGKADRNGANATGTWNGAAKTVEGTELGRLYSNTQSGQTLSTPSDWHQLPVGASIPFQNTSAGIPSPGKFGSLFKMFIQDTGGRSFYLAQGNVFNQDELFYGIGTNTALPVWYRFASREWVLSQIPSTPSLQEVTDVGNTTDNPLLIDRGNIAGTDEGIKYAQNGGSIVIRNGSSQSGQFIPAIIGNQNNSNAYGILIMGQGSDSYTIAAIQIRARNAAGNGSVTAGDIFEVVNNSTNTFSIDYQGKVKVPSLAGNGTRMVTVNPDGVFGSNEIPYEIQEDGYGYASPVTSFQSWGWDTEGGLIAKSVTVAFNSTYIEIPFNVLTFIIVGGGSPGGDIKVTNPEETPGRIIRIVNTAGDNGNFINAPIRSLSGGALTLIEQGKYIVIQSVDDGSGTYIWQQIGGNY